MGGGLPRRIWRQNSYASRTQEFATQPYPLANEVQTQPVSFCIISGGGDSAGAGCAVRAAFYWLCAARCQQLAFHIARKKAAGTTPRRHFGTAVGRVRPAKLGRDRNRRAAVASSRVTRPVRSLVRGGERRVTSRSEKNSTDGFRLPKRMRTRAGFVPALPAEGGLV